MQEQDDLFDLVKSLTKSEKRYFKLQAKIKGGEQEYLHLFETIDRLTEYDEKRIKEACASFKFSKHLAKAKNYLFNTIIYTLKTYTSENTIEKKMIQHLETIAFLHSKGLGHLSTIYIRNAKEIAEKLEDFETLLKLNQYEYKIASKHHSFIPDKKELLKEYSSTIDKLSNLLAYKKLYRQSYDSLHTAKNEESNTLNKLFNSPLLQNSKEALSFKAKDYFLHLWSLRHTLNADYTKQYYSEYDILKNFEAQYRDSLYEMPLQYAIRIHHFLIVASNTKKTDHFENYVNELKKLSQQKITISDKIRIEEYYWFHQLSYLYFCGEHFQINQLIDEIDKSSFLKKNNVRKKMKEAVICKLFNLFFIYNDFKIAQNYLELLLRNSKKEIHQLNSLARVFELLIFFETKNFQLFISRLEATRNYYWRNKIENQLENEFVLILPKLMNVMDKTEEKYLLENLKSKLYSILQKPAEKLKLEYFDFLLWIESKLSQQTMAELIKKISP